VYAGPTLDVRQLEPSLRGTQKFDRVEIVVVSSKHRWCPAVFVHGVALFNSFFTCNQTQEGLQDGTFVEAAALEN